MSYSSVVVFLDNSSASKKRLEFAFQFAQKHRAHLTGIHMSYGPLLPFDPYGQVSGVALDWEAEVKKKQHESKEYFNQQAKGFDVNVDWDCYRDNLMAEVLARARVADLCIVGQVASGSTDNEISRDFFTHFAINVGRPVLFVPYDKSFPASFEKIVVAWDGGREAGRAISDALPLLREARIVSVISVIPKKDSSDDLPDVDIGTFLARHKVNVEVEKIERVSSEAAEFILSRVDLKSANLLVMGAFGHSRFSEFILGGMTRSVMKKMNVPVFMSH
ncbi:nucleotide-binding universal stress UspA family protein [Oxalobacteraceae bacterium GrIS 2.11]